MLSERKLDLCWIDEGYETPDAGFFDWLRLTLTGDAISIAIALEEESTNDKIVEVKLTIEPGTFTSFEALAKFKNLIHLQIAKPSALHLTDLSTLGLRLKTFSIEKGEALLNLTSFQNFSGQVDSLFINKLTELKSLAGVANLHPLRKLTVSGCKEINDISETSQLQDLEYLYLSDISSMTDIAPLQRLPKLAQLILSCLPNLFDISHIQNLTTLEHFHLLQCPEVIEISPLGNLENLISLHIQKCPKIVDASALSKLDRKLKALSLRGCRDISYFQIASLQSDLPKCAIPLPWTSSSEKALRHHLAVACWRIFIYLSRWLRPSR